MSETVTVRYARADDTRQVKTLWEACFPGETAFSEYFFKSLYRPEQALLSVLSDGRLGAMVHMLPYTMMWLDQEVPMSYVYGVGTHPDCRRRGLAAGLMEQAFFEMHLRGVLFSTLIPQEDWLFDFYRPFGYAPVAFQPPRDYVFAATPRAATSADIPQLDALYRQHTKHAAHVIRNDEQWRAILEECALAGGRVVLDGAQGYAVYPGPDAAPTECFGPGARETGAACPFGCLRVVEADRAVALARRAGMSVPDGRLHDRSAPWNYGTQDSQAGALANEKVLEMHELAEILFFEKNFYMQLMHN